MTKIIYRNDDTNETILVADITTNRSMTVWEALAIANVNMDEFAEENGWDGWDPLALELEY